MEGGQRPRRRQGGRAGQSHNRNKQRENKEKQEKQHDSQERSPQSPGEAPQHASGLGTQAPQPGLRCRAAAPSLRPTPLPGPLLRS